MGLFRSVAIALSLVMAVHCASKPKPKAGGGTTSTDKCTSVPGVTGFDFNGFIGHNYKVAYLADVEEVKDYASGSESSIYINNKWYFTFTVNKKDKSQQILSYVIDRNEGSTIYETLLVKGQRTNSYSVHIYGYEALSFVQFTVCGQGLNSELRFALIYGDLKVTDDQKKKIISNDKALNFKSKLVEIGKQGGGSSTKSGTKDGNKGGQSNPKGQDGKDQGGSGKPAEEDGDDTLF